MSDRICSVLVCNEPVYGRGWCKGHHQRWLTKGDPGTTPIRKKRPGSKCSVDGCDRPHASRYFCSVHYRRWQDTGSPGDVAIKDHVVPRERLTYRAAHLRLAAQLGLARDQLCACGKQAAQWAYQHNDPDVMYHASGMPYSDKPECYAPMCVPCHKAYDLNT